MCVAADQRHSGACRGGTETLRCGSQRVGDTEVRAAARVSYARDTAAHQVGGAVVGDGVTGETTGSSGEVYLADNVGETSPRWTAKVAAGAEATPDSHKCSLRHAAFVRCARDRPLATVPRAFCQ